MRIRTWFELPFSTPDLQVTMVGKIRGGVPVWRPRTIGWDELADARDE